MTRRFCKSRQPDQPLGQVQCVTISHLGPCVSSHLSNHSRSTSVLEVQGSCYDKQGLEALGEKIRSSFSHLSHSPVCTSRRWTSLYIPCSASTELDMAQRLQNPGTKHRTRREGLRVPTLNPRRAAAAR